MKFRLNFGGGDFSSLDHLRAKIESLLLEIETQEDIGSNSQFTLAGRFRHIINSLHAKTGQCVVVLVDEYDKPILDTQGNPEVARANKDDMRGFYGVIKGANEHLRFVFLTGVSKFSKVNLFSGLNNLIDISMEPEYSSICGYTDRGLMKTCCAGWCRATLSNSRTAPACLDC